jgi:soluble lytic murein transglycosylase-like protein
MINKYLVVAALTVSPVYADVVTAIKTINAQHFGLPEGFVLAVANKESSFRLDARGDRGQSLGPFQIKCPTARGIGYTGSCGALLASAGGTYPGIYWGLKHLHVANGLCKGDLLCTATKHNGGLYWKRGNLPYAYDVVGKAKSGRFVTAKHSKPPKQALTGSAAAMEYLMNLPSPVN